MARDKTTKPSTEPQFAKAEAIRAYRQLYEGVAADDVAARRRAYEDLVNHFYDLVTDFYQFGWGDSFHFAPRLKGEGFKESLARLERMFADDLGLRSGMRALDVGCGVGGPMREIVRYSGAEVVGINNNSYQISKAKSAVRGLDLEERCSFVKADFMNIAAKAGTFDAAYTIESTVHAPDKKRVFEGIFQVLKPGARFVGTEWCLTHMYDPDNPEHRAIKAGIEVGNSLPEIETTDQVTEALRGAGFEVLESRDIAPESDPETPWYRALQGRDISLASLPRTPLGRVLTNGATRVLESLRLLPLGTTAVSTLLNRAADDLVAGGTTGIFTPLFYFKARKPGPG